MGRFEYLPPGIYFAFWINVCILGSALARFLARLVVLHFTAVINQIIRFSTRAKLQRYWAGSFSKKSHITSVLKYQILSRGICLPPEAAPFSWPWSPPTPRCRRCRRSSSARGPSWSPWGRCWAPWSSPSRWRGRPPCSAGSHPLVPWKKKIMKGNFSILRIHAEKKILFQYYIYGWYLFSAMTCFLVWVNTEKRLLNVNTTWTILISTLLGQY